jgi:hypothetical protein
VGTGANDYAFYDAGSTDKSLLGIVTATSLTTPGDGTHPGIISFAGNTTLPTLPANTFSIIGSPSATQTSWSLQGATAIPTTGHLLDCTVTSTNCLLHDSGVVTANVVNASSPGAGLAHFAGSTQTVTSSAVTSADATGNTSGSGNFCLVTSCVMVTPTLGAAVATSVATGTSPPTCAIGTAGVLCENEGTAPTGAASVDMVYADSTGHCLTAINNNVNDGCLLSVTNGGTFPRTIVSGVSGGIPYFSSTTAESASGILNTNIIVKGGGAGAAPTNSSITDDAKNITSSEVAVLGNKVFVTADFTDSTSTTLQAITGLTWTLPTSKAVNVSFHCSLLFDQGTAAVSDSFGIGVTGTAPTQANASGTVFTSASVSQTGTLTALASTTPTAVVTFTPSAITTIWKAELDGTIEQPSNATPGVFNIYVSTTTGTDNIIVKRGSYCSLF